MHGAQPDHVLHAEDGAFSPLIKQAAILVVDDEPGMQNFLLRTLVSRCAHVEAVGNVEAASRVLDARHFDLLILDNRMAGKSGLQWLRELRANGFLNDVILITAFADLETAIDAIRAGAADFVLKPFRTNQILSAISRSLDRASLRRENFLLRRELLRTPGQQEGATRIVGRSPRIEQIRQVVSRVAPVQTTVLLTGESGTGKEVTARALHDLSPRASKPFVPVNCAAIAPEIIESELFGHVKGAFTGASAAREGLFFYAQGGTLFLDEIGELPPSMQSKLLRVLEDRKVRPVGAEKEVPIDVRLIAATNADIDSHVRAGGFRQDLFYRLNVLRIELPPLRERREDVAPLARMFMERISSEIGVPPLVLSDDDLASLEAHDWPGNVRELRNTIERSIILGQLPGSGTTELAARPDSLADVEKRHMLQVLSAAGGNRAEAARRLGVSRKTLDRKCAEWNV